ncbi:MAG: hypothetical protein IJQ21_00890 [Lachnospiraceae bacterium]|nr:hypothetical protein [Lachnospiraceae bacterium]
MQTEERQKQPGFFCFRHFSSSFVIFRHLLYVRKRVKLSTYQEIMTIKKEIRFSSPTPQNAGCAVKNARAYFKCAECWKNADSAPHVPRDTVFKQAADAQREKESRI